MRRKIDGTPGSTQTFSTTTTGHVAAYPTVEVGSYPHPGEPDYRVKITLDGRDRAAVDAATTHLVARLGPAVVRTE